MKSSLFLAAIACGLASLAFPALTQEAPLPTGSDLPAAEKFLLSRALPGLTKDRFLQRLRVEFAQLDADGNAELSAADGEIHRMMSAVALRAAMVSQVVNADLDGDGATTEAELRRRLSYDQRGIAYRNPMGPIEEIERTIIRLLGADSNGDGRITIAEAESRAKALAQSDGEPPAPTSLVLRFEQMILLKAANRDVLSVKELDDAAATFFLALDADKDSRISIAEITSYSRQAVSSTEPVEKLKTQLENQQEADLRAVCPMPKASENAKVILLAAYESDAVSTAAIGSQDFETRAGLVTVQPGDTPLYVIIATHRATIWRFVGAIDRIEHVTLTSNSTLRQNMLGEVSLAGATGLPRDRVTFLKPRCLSYFSETPSVRAAKATAFIRKQVGKPPEVAASRYKVSGFVVPSGEIRSVEPSGRPTLLIHKPAGTLTIEGGANVIVQAGASDLARDVARSYPGGVVEIDPAAVVASHPVERYEVLPANAGLLQLIQNGALTRNKSGEYLIKEKMRFPAGLQGARSTKFLLLRGVPEPDGDPGHSCVVVEETGEPLRAGGSCR